MRAAAGTVRTPHVLGVLHDADALEHVLHCGPGRLGSDRKDAIELAAVDDDGSDGEPAGELPLQPGLRPAQVGRHA